MALLPEGVPSTSLWLPKAAEPEVPAPPPVAPLGEGALGPTEEVLGFIMGFPKNYKGFLRISNSFVRLS